jgi:hypothetical protein
VCACVVLCVSVCVCVCVCARARARAREPRAARGRCSTAGPRPLCWRGPLRTHQHPQSHKGFLGSSQVCDSASAGAAPPATLSGWRCASSAAGTRPLARASHRRTQQSNTRAHTRTRTTCAHITLHGEHARRRGTGRPGGLTPAAPLLFRALDSAGEGQVARAAKHFAARLHAGGCARARGRRAPPAGGVGAPRDMRCIGAWNPALLSPRVGAAHGIQLRPERDKKGHRS